ncbi:phosphoribosylamine--glycine ligase [Schleiferiaceae bacterium]|jgi:phosphoribosylamine---glycine ligase|nr:phosphoribosylamine--glycine ligase [Schleiferiaceae bacterium]
MNVLLLGSGGRESALAWKMAQSPMVESLFIAPGNPGMKAYGNCVSVDWKDRHALAHFCTAENIHMVVIGPEDPLVEGLADYFAESPELSHIHVIGPKKEAAQLEGSKDFSKEFMRRHGIPTAGHRTFTSDQLEEAKHYLTTIDGPYVLKADGLAAGKGVLILDNLADALHEMDAMLGQAKFGAASSRVVVEEFLDGIEFSVFVLTDGKDFMLMPEAKDYKRIGEGDRGLNTGGMGAVSPVPFVDSGVKKDVLSNIIAPTIRGLAHEKMDYVGFIFFGLIHTAKGVKVIEYNCRMGDPETEVVIPRVDEDLIPLFIDAATKKLLTRPMAQSEMAACTVMQVSGGYPEAYEKGKPISGLDMDIEGVLVFQAGTKELDGQIVSHGGRVLCATGMAPEASTALAKAYERLDQIEFEGVYRRNDIGVDLGLR